MLGVDKVSSLLEGVMFMDMVLMPCTYLVIFVGEKSFALVTALKVVLIVLVVVLAEMVGTSFLLVVYPLSSSVWALVVMVVVEIVVWLSFCAMEFSKKLLKAGMYAVVAVQNFGVAEVLMVVSLAFTVLDSSEVIFLTMVAVVIGTLVHFLASVVGKVVVMVTGGLVV